MRQDPIYAYFDVSERQVLVYRALRRRGETVAAEGERNKAYRALDTDDGFPWVGEVDYVSNRVMPDMSVRGALEKLWSASAVPGSTANTDQLECATCGIDLPEALKSIADKSFMVVIQDFQDPYTLNVKPLMKCCVEEITPDGRLIPFCAYNSVGYREQVREALSGVAVPTIVPNASPLQPVLLTTKYGSRTVGDGAARHDPADATNVGSGLRR